MSNMGSLMPSLCKFSESRTQLILSSYFLDLISDQGALVGVFSSYPSCLDRASQLVQLVVMEEVRRQADHMEKNIPEAVGEAFPPPPRD